MQFKRDAEEVAARLSAAGHSVDVTSLAVVQAIQYCARSYEALLETACQAHGTNRSGAEVLSALLLESDPRGLTLATLAAKLKVTPASITNRIDQLAAKGYVERVNSKDDRRISFAKLTKSGRQAAESLLPLPATVASELAKGMKKGDRKDLAKLIIKLAESNNPDSD